MHVTVGNCRLELVQGDITQQTVDAIVNAANSRLAGGGGVDGAIHRAGGATLMQETRTHHPDGCPTGSAVATSGGQLPAKFVFHAVGPVWAGGQRGEPDLLASAHHRCLELAVENGCQSIAFPAISTGVYGYPTDLAAETSLATVRNFLLERHQPELVRFVLFSGGAFGAFTRALETLLASNSRSPKP
ncbi:MAG: O-acetyl-ADP-ribose deacetylase [Planctomycetales bacterium]|nr:O-acetyl-ADP-ribose deacetylase [Planctomycetales bacterium]